jgi:hypothetical protein
MTAGPNVVGYGYQAWPKHFQKVRIVLGPAIYQDPMFLSLAKTDPKHFKKELGLTAQLDPQILGLARQRDLISLGLAAQPYPNILLFVL